MPRYFTLSQAAGLLPEVERLLRVGIEARREYELAESAMSDIQERVRMAGGMNLDRRQVLQLREDRERGARRLRESIEAVHELGVQVKDLNVGLVDFPTLYHGREVLLCWRLGERSIDHWHGLDEGFQSRKAIDLEFRQHHGGGTLH